VEHPRPFSGRGAGAGAVYARHRQLDCRYLPDQLKDHQPYNPSWSMRALAQYNWWHWQRITGTASDCERMAFVLSAYNGGLGWVQKDRKLASGRGLDASRYWNHVEKVNAGRSAANFRENRGYP
jgi:membrane-bound lytic murein transglycosylase MltF